MLSKSIIAITSVFLVVFVIGLYVYLSKRSKSSFEIDDQNTEMPYIYSPSCGKKHSFPEEGKLNLKEVPQYQNMFFDFYPPSMSTENDYHSCMIENCRGDYLNYGCRQNCYLKIMKKGTSDVKDMVCDHLVNSEDDYYKCLDAVYGNYLWNRKNINKLKR